jgi:hypothetical protein
VTAGDLTAPGTLTLGTYERLGELAASPAPPSAGRLNVYAKTDHKLYFQDSTGLESQLGSSLPIAGGSLLGNLLFVPDNTYDIGASGAGRPRDLWLGRDAHVGRTMVRAASPAAGGADDTCAPAMDPNGADAAAR